MAAEVTIEGDILEPVDYLRSTLAACARWQMLCGCSGGSALDQALARVHLIELPAPRHGAEHTLNELRKYRPFAICAPWSVRSVAIARSDGNEYTQSGRCMMLIEADVPAELANDERAAALWLYGHVGVIRREMQALAGLAGYLNITEIDMREPIMREDRRRRQDVGPFVAIEQWIAWAHGAGDSVA